MFGKTAVLITDFDKLTNREFLCGFQSRRVKTLPVADKRKDVVTNSVIVP